MVQQIVNLFSNESRKFYRNWGWYLLAAIIFIVIPQGTAYVEAQKLELERSAILSAPDSEYLEFVQYAPEDLCVEDEYQNILLERIPSNTDVGWKAILVDEIGVQASNNVWGKFNGDYNYLPFYEVIPGTDSHLANTIILTIPLQTRFVVGTFRWESQITLKIPMSNGEVVLKSLERVYSDEFVVTKECAKSSLI